MLLKRRARTDIRSKNARALLPLELSLCNVGLDVTWNPSGDLILLLGDKAGDEPVLELLIDTNIVAEVNTVLQCSLKGSSVTHTQQTRIMNLFIVHGVRVTQKNKLDLSAVHFAAANGKISALEILLAANPELVYAKTVIKETPLFFAVKNNHIDCVNLLLQCGASTEIHSLRKQRPIELTQSQDIRFVFNPTNISCFSKETEIAYLRSAIPAKRDDEETTWNPSGESKRMLLLQEIGLLQHFGAAVSSESVDKQSSSLIYIVQAVDDAVRELKLPSRSTFVWWDISRCPIPADPCLVGPRIETALKISDSSPYKAWKEKSEFVFHAKRLFVGEDLESERSEALKLELKMHILPCLKCLKMKKAKSTSGGLADLLFCVCCECTASVSESAINHVSNSFLGLALPKMAMPLKKTSVWWDISSCPIPDGFDPCLVGRRIETALKKSGYSDPVTITAIGNLRKGPGEDVLRKLSSSGIALNNAIRPLSVMHERSWSWNPYPATTMLISGAPEELITPSDASFLVAYHQPIPSSLWKSSLNNVSKEWLWKSLLSDDDMDSGSAHNKHKTTKLVLQDKYYETGESPLYCSVCYSACQSLEDFCTHLKSGEHAYWEWDLWASGKGVDCKYPDNFVWGRSKEWDLLNVKDFRSHPDV